MRPSTRRRNGATLIAIGAALWILSGCGGETPKAKPIVLPPPTTPTTADCGLTGEGSRRESENPPPAGKYTYDFAGVRQVSGGTNKTTKLPPQMQVLITDAIRDGGQSCFTMQRRYERDFGDTATIVVNGSDFLLRSGLFQTGGEIIDFIPDPPIVLLSGDQTEWSGSFTGTTSGRYKATLIDRKRVRIDGKSIEVAGIQTDVSYSGEIEGTESAERWLAINSGLLISESVKQRRAFGLDTLKLRYKSKLKSLDPTASAD